MRTVHRLRFQTGLKHESLSSYRSKMKPALSTRYLTASRATARGGRRSVPSRNSQYGTSLEEGHFEGHRGRKTRVDFDFLHFDFDAA